MIRQKVRKNRDMYCNNCGKQNQEKSKYCKFCGSRIIKISEDSSNPEAQASTESERAEKPKKEKIQAGLGGWLALVGIGLFATIIFQSFSAFSYPELFNYSYEIPGYMTLLVFEFIYTISFILGAICLLFLYFYKKVNFPNLYICFLIYIIAVSMVDLFWLGSLNISDIAFQDSVNQTISESIGELGREVLISIIWITYMLKSKQVKITFVN